MAHQVVLANLGRRLLLDIVTDGACAGTGPW